MTQINHLLVPPQITWEVATKMKKVLLIWTIFISTLAFGQQEIEVIAKYKDTERIGNVLTRWYYDLLGTSLVWKQSLTLYSDSTYRYVYQGGECGTFDEDIQGTWTLSNNLLTLHVNDLPDRAYQLIDDKLYWPETEVYDKHHVVMK